MKRRRKIPKLDRVNCTLQSANHCEFQFSNTDYDAIQLTIKDAQHNVEVACAVLNDTECFQLIRAMALAAARQWGEHWLERIIRYLEQIVVVRAE